MTSGGVLFDGDLAFGQQWACLKRMVVQFSRSARWCRSSRPPQGWCGLAAAGAKLQPRLPAKAAVVSAGPVRNWYAFFVGGGFSKTVYAVELPHFLTSIGNGFLEIGRAVESSLAAAACMICRPFHFFGFIFGFPVRK